MFYICKKVSFQQNTIWTAFMNHLQGHTKFKHTRKTWLEIVENRIVLCPFCKVKQNTLHYVWHIQFIDGNPKIVTSILFYWIQLLKKALEFILPRNLYSFIQKSIKQGYCLKFFTKLKIWNYLINLIWPKVFSICLTFWI